MDFKAELTREEIDEVFANTVHKIYHYPPEDGKTLDNYFDLLFPDEVKNYLTRRDFNRRGRENWKAGKGCVAV